MITIRDLLTKIKTSRNKSLVSYLSDRGYTLTLKDSVTEEPVIITVDNILEDDEVISADLSLYRYFGGLEIAEFLLYYFNDFENPTTDEINNLCDAIIAKNKSSWYHIKDALHYKYNPTWNKFELSHVTESWKDYKETDDKINEQLENAETITEQLESGETASKVFGLDSTEGVDDSRLITDAGKSKITNDAGKSEEKTERTIEGEHITTSDGGGNVGTTMSSQIIAGELDVYGSETFIKRVVYDIVDFIGSALWS